MILSATEKQLLIIIKHLIIRESDTSIEDLEKFGGKYFCSYKLDWGEAFTSLLEKGIIHKDNNKFFINEEFDDLSSDLVGNYPRFRYWYNDWYRLAEVSEAHSILCDRAYGKDLCQTGMMTINQINYLIDNVIEKDKQCLDLGCGSGHITEYIADKCSANITGIDVISNGIRLARQRTLNKREYLKFYLKDMLEYNSSDKKFDYIFSFDTIYFVGNQLSKVIESYLNILNTSGKLIIFYSAWNPKDEDLSVDSTKLGKYLNEAGLKYAYVDFTEDDKKHWQLKYDALLDLKSKFIEEGNKILFDNRFIEAEHFTKLAKENKLVRYLYLISNC